MSEKEIKDAEKASKDTKKAEVAPENAVAERPAFEMFDLSAFDEFKAVDGQIKGFEHVDKNDLKIAVYTIMQPTSEMVTESEGKVTPGMFYNTMTKEFSKEINTTLLTMVKTRVLWPKPFKRGQKALCRSFDGIKGVGVPGGTCANCSKKEWGDNNEPPACRMGYNWLGLDHDDDLKPFKFTAISSGVSPTKDFITAVKRMGYHLFVFKVNISTKKEKNESGSFYVPEYKLVGTVDKKDAKMMEDMLANFKSMFEEDVVNDLEHDISGTMGSMDEAFVPVEDDDDVPF